MATGSLVTGFDSLLEVAAALFVVYWLLASGCGDKQQLANTDEVLNRFKDVAKRARAVVGDPPDFASFLAHVMTGKHHRDELLETNVVRFSPLILGDYSALRWRPPDWLDKDHIASRDRFARLVTMDMDAHSDAQALDIRMLAEAWLDDRAWNQPIRFNFFQDPARGIHAEIGHLRFSGALRRARELRLVPDGGPMQDWVSHPIRHRAWDPLSRQSEMGKTALLQCDSDYRPARELGE